MRRRVASAFQGLFSTSHVLVKESENIRLPFSDSRVHEIVPVICRATDRRINLQNVRLAKLASSSPIALLGAVE